MRELQNMHISLNALFRVEPHLTFLPLTLNLLFSGHLPALPLTVQPKAWRSSKLRIPGQREGPP
jgi:hypothetical protein